MFFVNGILRYVVFFLVLLTLASCVKDKDDLAYTKMTPQLLYQNGNYYYQQGQYLKAKKHFAYLDQLYPYSEYAKVAVFKQVEVSFRLEEYTEVRVSAKRYLVLHPNTPESVQVQYLVAESYYRQVLDVARDQNFANNAIAAFTELLERHPNSKYTQEAKNKIAKLKGQLAAKEMAVGRYYLSNGDYFAAVNRFNEVIEHYGATNQREEALGRLVESYLSLGLVKEARASLVILGRDYPKGYWYAAKRF